MAIYRTGQASMDADGYITGYGTKWKTALTLIRPGATIVFASNPVAYATISEIVNDTSLRATSTGGAVVPRGDYVILLHDSITVDGLAQDVAETLRYYQGQETMYQEFVEFLKGFDWQKLEEMERNTEANAAAADASARAAAQSESNANASKNAAAASATTSSQQASAAASSASAAKVSENNAASSKTAAANSASAAATSATTAGQHKDAAAASASAAKTSETNANASKTAAAASQTAAKTSETNAKASETNAATSASAANTAKNDAQTAASSANASKSAAASSASSAAGSATTAKNEADRAAALADQLDATNLMRKDANLSDLQDKSQARKNIALDRFNQHSSGETNMKSGDGTKQLYVKNNGSWGVWDNTTNSSSPLPVESGGTGAKDAEGARQNIGLGGGDSVSFSHVWTPNGFQIKTSYSASTNNPSAAFVAQLIDGSQVKSQAEFRADATGTISIINRGNESSPQFASFSQSGDFSVPNLVSSRSIEGANAELGYRNKNTASYIDLHYGGKYDYDARIICDGYNSDQNGGGNLRLYCGYLELLSKSARALIQDKGVSIRGDGATVLMQPATEGSACYILGRSNSGSNEWYVGRGGSDQNVTFHSYSHNTMVQLRSGDVLINKDITANGNCIVNGSSIYVDGGSGSSNTHLWLRNSSKRNRAVIYSSDSQSLEFRSDNAGTGAAGQKLTLNGATGECRAVAFTSTSDERAKFWIKPVTGALDKICSLRGVTYSMHTTIQNTVRNAGVIAQDVQKVLPEAVSVSETGGTIDKACREVENPLSLDYNALSALYVEAFKEMRDLINAQKAEIESLKSTVASLQAQSLI